MSAIQWDDNYNLGIPEIDEQHQNFIGIINRLFDAIDQGKGEEAVRVTLEEMKEYAEKHFNLEEKYFNQFHYDKTEAHLAQHETFRYKTHSLESDLKVGGPAVFRDALAFLAGWFIDHIQTVDRQYVEFFHEHGL